MNAKELYNILIKIESRLSRIEGKQDVVCKNTQSLARRIDRTEDAIRNLPCDAHSNKMLDEVTKRVPWTHFWQVIGVLIVIMMASFTYINHVDDDLKIHETSLTPHFNRVDKGEPSEKITFYDIEE